MSRKSFSGVIELLNKDSSVKERLFLMGLNILHCQYARQDMPAILKMAQLLVIQTIAFKLDLGLLHKGNSHLAL